MSDIARFLDQASAAGGLSPFEAAQVHAARDDARAAVEDQRKQVDREAAAEQRLESILLTERAMGQPMAEAARGRQDLAEADEECAELAERLRKAEAKRDRVRSNLEFWANRAQQATVMAARSDAASGVEGAVIRARSVLAAAAEDQRRDVLARARAQVAARRPAAPSRPRVSVRSASLPKAPAQPCGCGVPGCDAYPAETERSAQRDWSDIGGRKITRYGGPIVSVR